MSDIKQELRAWLGDQTIDAWWSPGTREAMTKALAEIERLEKEVTASKAETTAANLALSGLAMHVMEAVNKVPRI